MRTIFAFGGLVGSGKTTFGKIAAAWLQIPIISFDVTHKEMYGMDPLERLPDWAYSEEAPITYGDVMFEMFHRGSEGLRSGHDVVLDMPFRLQVQVEMLYDFAHANHALVVGIWCKTFDIELQRERVRNRRDDASDAQVNVLDWMLENGENEPPAGWLLLDTTGTIPEVSHNLSVLLGLSVG